MASKKIIVILLITNLLTLLGLGGYLILNKNDAALNQEEEYELRLMHRIFQPDTSIGFRNNQTAIYQRGVPINGIFLPVWYPVARMDTSRPEFSASIPGDSVMSKGRKIRKTVGNADVTLDYEGFVAHYQIETDTMKVEPGDTLAFEYEIRVKVPGKNGKMDLIEETHQVLVVE